MKYPRITTFVLAAAMSTGAPARGIMRTKMRSIRQDCLAIWILASREIPSMHWVKLVVTTRFRTGYRHATIRIRRYLRTPTQYYRKWVLRRLTRLRTMPHNHRLK